MSKIQVKMDEMEVRVGVIMRELKKLGEHWGGTNQSLKLILARQEGTERLAKAVK